MISEGKSGPVSNSDNWNSYIFKKHFTLLWNKNTIFKFTACI